MVDAGVATANGNRLQRLRAYVNALYNGRSRRAERFRYFLLAFDIVTIAIFIVDSLTPPIASMITIDVTIAILLILDFSARLLIARPIRRYLLDPVTISDLVVIATLAVASFDRELGVPSRIAGAEAAALSQGAP